MLMITLFPHPPDVFLKVVDALADEADEPSAANVQATVRNFNLADEMSHNLASIQSYIYKTGSSRAVADAQGMQ